MLQSSKVLAGILALFFLATVFPIAGWAGTYGQVEHSADCHHRAPIGPAPAHRSHECCAIGHHWAMPGSPVVTHHRAVSAMAHVPAETVQPIVLHDRLQKAVSASPPTFQSLRV